MPLNASVDAWRRLADELDGLATATGATNAIIGDAWGHLWCRASVLSDLQEALAFSLLDRALASAARPLVRGGRIAMIRSEEEPFFLARSFAGVYVLAMWFPGPFPGLTTLQQVTLRLPTIEAMTVALPPPDGPTTNSGAVRKSP